MLGKKFWKDSQLRLKIFYWWGIDYNYKQVRAAMRQQSTFGFGLMSPMWLRRKMLQKTNITSKVECIKKARECLNSLESMLYGKTYFFDAPCSLDALVFGYVSCCYYPEFKDHSMQDLLKNCPLLTKFCDTVAKKFFAKDFVPKIPTIQYVHF